MHSGPEEASGTDEVIVLGCPSAEWIADAQLRIAGRERARLARLLHEELSQTLLGAQLMASVLQRRVAAAAPEHLPMVRAFSEELREVGLALKELTKPPLEDQSSTSVPIAD